MRGWFSALTAPTARAPYGRSNPAVNPSVPLGRIAAFAGDITFGTSTVTTNLNSATYKAGRRYRVIISWPAGGSTGTTTGQHLVNLPGGASPTGGVNQNLFKFDVAGAGNTSGVYVFEFTVASDVTFTMSVGSRLLGGAGNITISGFSITVDDIGQ